MTSVRDPRGAMESTLAAPGSATGPVTFSHVFGQQCQLMEAGRKCAAREGGRRAEPPGQTLARTWASSGPISPLTGCGA